MDSLQGRGETRGGPKDRRRTEPTNPRIRLLKNSKIKEECFALDPISENRIQT